MERRYRWMNITLLTCFLFAGLYFITYFVAATSYSFFSSEPADQSREVSSIYYGTLFSTIPYFPMGLLLYSYVRQRPLMLTAHAVGIGLLMEKNVFVYLATLLGAGYPWYGRNFPWSGYAVLCEELPMFCGKVYLWNYQVWGPMLALGTCYAGTWIFRKTKIAFQDITRQQP